MPRKGKREHVTFKSVRLALYPHGERWRVAFPDDSVKGGWRYLTRSTKALAKEAGHAKAVEIARGMLDLSNLTEEQAKLARAFLDLTPTWDDLDRLRNWKTQTSKPIGEAVELYCAELSNSRHHQSLASTLRRFANEKESAISHITKEDLTAWITSQEVGAIRQNQFRACFVQFWTWAKREQLVEAPEGLTAADRIPRQKKPAKKAIRYLSPAEMSFILDHVTPDYLPWVVLSGFAAIRSEEVHPRNYGDKKPLDWSQVKRDRGIIDLRADQSKVGKRRLIPITSTLEAWLKKISPPESGRIVPGPPTAWQTKKLGEQLDEHFDRSEGWPRNGLRHTFMTYSAAIRKDLPAIAIEGGTSVAKLNTNYVEAANEDDAEAFFGLIPGINLSDLYRTA